MFQIRYLDVEVQDLRLKQLWRPHVWVSKRSQHHDPNKQDSLAEQLHMIMNSGNLANLSNNISSLGLPTLNQSGSTVGNFG